MAATRLIALHKNKGKSVVACLKSRTDYAQKPGEDRTGRTGQQLRVQSSDGGRRIYAVQAAV